MNNPENYPTWLVPLDIAKELKEIGFNENCHFYWDNHLNLVDCYDNENGYPDLEGYNSNKHQIKYSLPTWTEVFAWFRARGLYSYIRSYIAPENFYIYSIYDNNNFDKCCGRRDTYEAAQKECVKALIQTYKNELKKNNL